MTHVGETVVLMGGLLLLLMLLLPIGTVWWTASSGVESDRTPHRPPRRRCQSSVVAHGIVGVRPRGVHRHHPLPLARYMEVVGLLEREFVDVRCCLEDGTVREGRLRGTATAPPRLDLRALLPIASVELRIPPTGVTTEVLQVNLLEVDGKTACVSLSVMRHHRHFRRVFTSPRSVVWNVRDGGLGDAVWVSPDCPELAVLDVGAPWRLTEVDGLVATPSLSFRPTDPVSLLDAVFLIAFRPAPGSEEDIPLWEARNRTTGLRLCWSLRLRGGATTLVFRLLDPVHGVNRSVLGPLCHTDWPPDGALLVLGGRYRRLRDDRVCCTALQPTGGGLIRWYHEFNDDAAWLVDEVTAGDARGRTTPDDARLQIAELRFVPPQWGSVWLGDEQLLGMQAEMQRAWA